MKTIKNVLWFSVGVTAIVAEKAYDTCKYVHEEVKAGTPQKLVRDTISNVKEQFNSEPTIEWVTKKPE